MMRRSMSDPAETVYRGVLVYAYGSMRLMRTISSAANKVDWRRFRLRLGLFTAFKWRA